MSTTNDSFRHEKLSAVTISGKVYNDSEIRQPVVETMSEILPYQNSLLETILILRGEKYTLDGIHYTELDVHNQLVQLCQRYNVTDHIDVVKQYGRDFCKLFLIRTYIDKKGKLQTSVNGRSKEYANSFFSLSEGKKVDSKFKAQCPSMVMLRKYGFFPILINGREFQGHHALKYSMAQEVLSKTTSFIKISQQYEDNKEYWTNIVAKQSGILPKLEKYSNLLHDIKEIKELAKFKQDNFRKFLNRWRGDHREGKRQREGMREYFLRLYKDNPDHSFSEKERYLFGYCPQFMNLIYHKYKDLWLEEDIIGRQLKTEKLKGKDYVDLVFNCFHWSKESVGISSFGKNGKLPRILLGDNFIHFDIEKTLNGEWVVTIDDLRDGTKKKRGVEKSKCRLIICKSPHFDETTTLTVTNKTKKDGKIAEKETHKIRYSADSKKKTWCTGLISQPTLEFHKDKDACYIHLPLAEYAVEGPLDSYFHNVEDINNARYYFMASMPSNSRQVSKRLLKDGSFRVMGVDLNVVERFVLAIYDIMVENNRIIDYRCVKIVKSHKNTDYEEKERELLKLISKIQMAKNLIWQTKGCIRENDKSVELTFNYNGKDINIQNEFGINMEKFAKLIAQYKTFEDKESALSQIKRDNDWILHSLVHEIKLETKKIRNEFSRLGSREARSDFHKNRNYNDGSVLRKKELNKLYVDLVTSYSTFGLSNDEIPKIKANKNGGSFAADMHDWYNGLVRKSNQQLASDIIGVARDNNVKIIFLEDLDCKTSLFNSKDDNNLKILLGWGGVKKWLSHQAKKHNIGIVAIDPYLTSQVHYKTGLLCAEKGRDLYVFLPNGKVEKINRDENAAHHITLRGIFRHLNLRSFQADQISENEYRIMAKATNNDDLGNIILENGNPSENNTDKSDTDKSDIEKSDAEKSEKGKTLIGKRKAGALYHHLGSLEGIFEKQKDGSLKVKRTKLTPEDMAAKKINDNRIDLILHGDTWYVKNELKEELQNKLEAYLTKSSMPIKNNKSIKDLEMV